MSALGILVFFLVLVLSHGLQALEEAEDKKNDGDECLSYREFFDAEDITSCQTIHTAVDTRAWVKAGGTVLARQDGRFHGSRSNGTGFHYLRPCVHSTSCHLLLTIDSTTSKSRLSSLYEDDTVVLGEEGKGRNLQQNNNSTKRHRRRRRRHRRRTHYPSAAPSSYPSTTPTSSPSSSSSSSTSADCKDGCISADGSVCYVCGEPNYPADLLPCGAPPCTLFVKQTVTVLYSPTLLASSTMSDLDVYTQLAVTQTNQIYQNSLIPIRMILNLTMVSSFDETGDSYTDLINLRKAGPPPGGSNMAVFLTRNLGSCGRAFLDCTSYSTPQNCALAVVRASCAVGYYSFAHEIGHIQGADHNYQFRSTASSRFPDGYGYDLDPKKTSDGGYYRTVMAYDNGNGETRIPYFSGPELSYMGAPTGVAGQADNARVLRQTRKAVSQL